MTKTRIGLCTLDLHLQGIASLKEKRGILKSMLKKLHNTYNVSAAEVDYHDKWQSAQIAITTVSNSSRHSQQVIDNVIEFIERHYPEAMIIKQELEIL